MSGTCAACRGLLPLTRDVESSARTLEHIARVLRKSSQQHTPEPSVSRNVNPAVPLGGAASQDVNPDWEQQLLSLADDFKAMEDKCNVAKRLSEDLKQQNDKLQAELARKGTEVDVKTGELADAVKTFVTHTQRMEDEKGELLQQLLQRGDSELSAHLRESSQELNRHKASLNNAVAVLIELLGSRSSEREKFVDLTDRYLEVQVELELTSSKAKRELKSVREKVGGIEENMARLREENEKLKSGGAGAEDCPPAPDDAREFPDYDDTAAFQNLPLPRKLVELWGPVMEKLVVQTWRREDLPNLLVHWNLDRQLQAYLAFFKGCRVSRRGRARQLRLARSIMLLMQGPVAIDDVITNYRELVAEMKRHVLGIDQSGDWTGAYDVLMEAKSRYSELIRDCFPEQEFSTEREDAEAWWRGVTEKFDTGSREVQQDTTDAFFRAVTAAAQPGGSPDFRAFLASLPVKFCDVICQVELQNKLQIRQVFAERKFEPIMHEDVVPEALARGRELMVKCVYLPGLHWETGKCEVKALVKTS